MQPIYLKAAQVYTRTTEQCRNMIFLLLALLKMLKGGFSLGPPGCSLAAIHYGCLGGKAPEAAILTIIPASQVENIFIHFPISTDLTEQAKGPQGLA